MIDLIKNTNSFGYNTYILKDNNKSLIIDYNNVEDLFFYFDHSKDDINDNITITITKENYYIYNLFLKLYTSIKNRTPYINSKIFNNEDNSKYQKLSKHIYNQPFHDNIIDWYSDDTPTEFASRLIIEKKKDIFLITITKNTEKFNLFPYIVRIRNNGSRYNPYNVPFMILYHNLECYPYNYPYHQIHIEEYLYQKRKTKRK